MPKKFLRKYIPNPAIVAQNKWLKLLGSRILDHNLWHLNRRATASGVFIGLFAAFIPLPIQAVTVAVLCLFTRSNLPIGLLFTWISNPVTYIPLYYFSYQVGNLVLGLDSALHINAFTLNQFTETAGRVWRPLFLGCAITGIATASFGYATTHSLWRYHVLKQWRRRQSKANKAVQLSTSANDEVDSQDQHPDQEGGDQQH